LLQGADDLVGELEPRITDARLLDSLPLPTLPPGEVRPGMTWLVGNYGHAREHVGHVQLTKQLYTARIGPLPEDHFGDRVAEDYDESEAAMFAPSVIGATAEFLADLAGPGPVLELGIGTGRIAFPLSERGLDVHGVDLSPAMLAKLRAKRGAGRITLTQGDFASISLDRQFSLIYLVFNTIMNLTTQQDQLACFHNVARHLRPGGRFVIETCVPGIRRLPPGQTVVPFRITPTTLGFDEYEVASQRVVSHHYRVLGGHVDVRAIPFRYVWPAELDLMARIAGLQLVERWGGWNGEPFTGESERHVSVWEGRRGAAAADPETPGW
jgi:SAM-dependent methyltransferase